jgi:hypothetical protein
VYWWPNSLFRAFSDDAKEIGAERVGLFQIVKDGKWGLMDRTGRTVLEPQFDYISAFSEGVAVAVTGNQYGLVNSDGGIAVPAKLNFIGGDFSDGLAMMLVGDRYGFISQDGTVKINPQFDGAGPFSEGFAAVRVGDKWGYTDTRGNLVIKPQFDDAGVFSAGLAAVNVGERWGYIDTHGKYVVNPQFDSVQSFEGNRAFVEVGQKYALIDTHGKYVTNPEFDYVGSYSEGLAPVQQGDKWGFIDRDGKVAIAAQFYTVPTVGARSNPTSVGEQVQPGWRGFRNGTAIVVVGEPRVERPDGEPVLKGLRYGTIRKDGEFQITPQFDSMESFEDGLALVRIDRKYGFVNASGTIVITPQFDEAASFSEGRARVRIGSKWGFIGTDGKMVVTPQYELAADFFDGLSEVISDGQLGYIDPDGRFVRPLAPMYALPPPTLVEFLNAQAPGWHYPKLDRDALDMYRGGAQPFYATGDFNGDGIADHAVRVSMDAIADGRPRIVIFFGEDSSFAFAFEGDGDYITVLKTGEEVPAWGALSHDAVSSGYYEKSSWAYIYQDGRFHTAYMSD